MVTEGMCCCCVINIANNDWMKSQEHWDEKNINQTLQRVRVCKTPDTVVFLTGM